MTSQKEQLSYLLKSDKDLEELIKSIHKIVTFNREKSFEGLGLDVKTTQDLFNREHKIEKVTVHVNK